MLLTAIKGMASTPEYLSSADVYIFPFGLSLGAVVDSIDSFVEHKDGK